MWSRGSSCDVGNLEKDTRPLDLLKSMDALFLEAGSFWKSHYTGGLSFK